MKDPYKKKFITNIRKTKGLLEAIEKMVDEDRYCVDVAQQVNAALGFLRSANSIVLTGHLDSCAATRLNSEKPEEKQEFISELVRVFGVSSR